jgi:hypothetical protein
VVILGREAGVPLELGGVPPDNLVPAALRGSTSKEEFMTRLAEHDGAMAARAAEAAAKVRQLLCILLLGPCVPLCEQSPDAA